MASSRVSSILSMFIHPLKKPLAMEGLGLIKSYVKLVRDTLRAKRKPPCGWQTDDVSLPSETICAKFAYTTSCMSSPEADLAKRTKIKPACAGLEESQNRLRRLHHCILQFDQKDFQHGSA